MAIIVKSSEVEGKVTTEGGAKGLVMKALFGPAPGRRLNSNLGFLEPGGRSKAHSHDWEQINFVVSGKGLYKNGDGPGIPVETGTALHIPGSELHWFENTGTEPLVTLGILGPMPGNP